MPRPVDHLSEPGHQLDVPFGSADQGLSRRLRDLPPNHPSADPDARRPGGAGADGERSATGDAEPEGERALSPPLWNHVDQLREMWADHLQRWPESRHEQPSGQERHRDDDPPGSWRGDGDQCLSPDENAEADEIIAALRKCEPAVTELLEAIERDNHYGGYLIGLEHRLKGVQRLKEKIADKMAVRPGSRPADVADGIVDAVRYTFCFGDETSYVRGCDDLQSRLEANGYELVYRRNHWLSDPQYKGVNCRWKSPDGSLFELQLHTAESFYAKEHLTHPAYERARRPTTSRAEERALANFQTTVCAAVTVPARIFDVTDHNVRL